MIEDETFYEACDEFGVMLLQEMPHAGCAPGGPGDQNPDYAKLLPVDFDQQAVAFETLKSYASIIRWNYANEFYLNSSLSPFVAQFLAQAYEQDDSRPAHLANPTSIAIRHGPYMFSAGDAEYDRFGSDCNNGTNGTVLLPTMDAGCANQGDSAGGVSNPFGWDEFGATGLTDIETINWTVPADQRAHGWQGAVSPAWQYHRFGQWGNTHGYRVLFTDGAAALATLEQEIGCSQFLQSEAYRFMWQSHRRAKPHRSEANAWTFNEPWPNAAHGSIIGYSGQPKQAYYGVKEAMGMVDASLLYGGLRVQGGSSLHASGVSLWVESELAVSITCDITLKYAQVGGSEVLATERLSVELPAVAGRKLAASGVLRFAPPLSSLELVLLVQLSMSCVGQPDIQHTYTFKPMPNNIHVTMSGAPLATPPPEPLLRALTDQPVLKAGSAVALMLVPPSGGAGENWQLKIGSNATVPLLFLKIVARFRDGNLVPFFLASANYFVLLPADHTTVNLTLAQEGLDMIGSEVCVSAWNAQQSCVHWLSEEQPSEEESRVQAALKTDDEVERYGAFELLVRLNAPPDNVFDMPLSVTVAFTDPAGAVYSVQPFYFQNFTRWQLANGSEVLAPIGRPHFLVRFSPAKLGDYTYRVHGATTAAECTSGRLRVSGGSDVPGFATVGRGQQYFRAGNSTQLFLLGENIVFPGPDPILTTYNYTNLYPAAHMGTYMYDDYFAKLAANGGNYVRLWIGLSCLPPKNTPVSLAGGAGARFGFYSLDAAWRIDHILSLGKRLGIYVLLCFEAQQSFQMLFNDSIYSVANGGPLTSTAELWTSPAIQAEFKQRLRYSSSRFGYSTSTFAYQFFNEHNDFPHFVEDAQIEWVANLSSMIKSYDPYDHLVHDSFGGLPVCRFAPSIDFATLHKYGSEDFAAEALSTLPGLQRQWGKPVFWGETALSAGGPNDAKIWWKDDRASVHLHNALWASAVSTAAGGAMHWWWHEFDDHNAYQHFAPLRKFIDRLPLLHRHWLHLPIDMSNGTLAQRSCSLPAQPGHFSTDQGQVVDNFAGGDPLTCQQHCCQNKQCDGWIFTKHQEISTRAPCEMGQPCCWLKADVKTITPLANCTAGVMKTSMRTGNWEVNGGVMLGKIDTNTGHNDTAAIWLHNAAHTWHGQHSSAGAQLVGPVHITLHGFIPGHGVTLSLVDTYTGAITSNQSLTVANSGGLELHFEPFTRDVAAIVTTAVKTDDEGQQRTPVTLVKADGCTDEADCGYNGVCRLGVCHCLPPWTGPECQRLSLKDVHLTAGLREMSTSTWGGSVVHGDDERLYMYASEMVAHCGIEAWTRNSRVIVASADNISAPFRFEKELFGVFSHEPAAVRAPTGEYVLYFTTTTLGCGAYGQCVPDSICPGMGNGSTCNPGGPSCWTQCHDGSTPSLCFANKVDASPLCRYPTYMAYASHPLGPFSKPLMVYNGTDGQFPNSPHPPATGDTNFAGVILEDGSLVGMWKGDLKGGRRWSLASYLYSVYASDWRQPSTYRWPYTTKANNIFPELVPGNETRTCEIEDPTLFYDRTKGVIHAVVHNWESGGHAASTDRGKSWRWYGGNCSAADGSGSLDWSRSVWPSSFNFQNDVHMQTPRRRERPHVLLDKDGVVMALTTALLLGKSDATWTLVQETNRQIADDHSVAQLSAVGPIDEGNNSEARKGIANQITSAPVVPRGPTNNSDLKASGPAYNHTFTKHINKTTGALDCQATCDAATRCRAWTYVPNGDGKTGPEALERCCLFPRLGCPAARQGVVSGAKTAGPCSGPHPPPAPPPPPIPPPGPPAPPAKRMIAADTDAMLFFDKKRFIASSSGLSAHVGESSLVGVFVDPTTYTGWGYPSVFRLPDGRGFRALYEGWTSHPGDIQVYNSPRVVLAADSLDGVHFSPANLSLPPPSSWLADKIHTNFTWPTNAVWGPTAGLSFVLDDGCGLWRDCPSEERLKALVKEGATIHALSADGLSGWTRPFAKWSKQQVDPGCATYRNPLNDSEVIVTGRPQNLRKTSGRHAGVNWGRGWAVDGGLGEKLFEQALPLDKLFGSYKQIYGLPSFSYAGMVVSFAWRLYCSEEMHCLNYSLPVWEQCGTNCGKVFGDLAYSYDSRAWSGFVQGQNDSWNTSYTPLFPNVAGREDAGQTYPNSLLEVDGRLLVHASAATVLHGAATVGTGRSSIVTYEIRMDGFVYLVADEKSRVASFSTVPVKWRGGELLVNADASHSADDGVTVAVLDEMTGVALPGYEAANSSAFVGRNETAQVWSWHGGSHAMSALVGKVIRFEVALRGGARLYSLRGKFDSRA
jgi:hypothetical protein